MPYYLHRSDQPPESGTPYADRGAAHRAKQEASTPSDLAITFQLTESERTQWQRRERARFSNGAYVVVPWYRDAWYYSANCGTESGRQVGGGVDRSFDNTHFAHMSTEQPGLIAYTPSEEHGYADRQIRVRPGKYLADFAPQLTAAERDALCDRCRPAGPVVIHLADDEATIDRVYAYYPDSCMCNASHHWTYDPPSRAYAPPSDLRVAYLTVNGKPDGDVCARAVVWPERKVYASIYSSDKLAEMRVALARDGYKQGDFAGAYIKAIKVKGNYDRYLMPYTDSVERAVLTSRAGVPMFRLTEDGGTDTHVLRGYVDLADDSDSDSDDDRERYYCGREYCDNEIDEDESYCRSCERERNYCNRCNEDVFGDEGTTIDRFGWVCDSCESDLRCECARPDCNETFYREQFRRSAIDLRRANGTNDLCADCADEYRPCTECSEYVLIDTSCLECHPTIDSLLADIQRCIARGNGIAAHRYARQLYALGVAALASDPAYVPFPNPALASEVAASCDQPF